MSNEHAPLSQSQPTCCMSSFQPVLTLVPSHPKDQYTITIEVYQGNGKQQRVPVELQLGVGLASEAEVAIPDRHEDHHGQTHNLQEKEI